MLIFRRPRPYAGLEKTLGYRFKTTALLELALTHRSYRHETDGVTGDNQRLEYLGDAALGLAAAAHLYAEDATADEGLLTERRSRQASGRSLAGAARRLGLGAWLRLGHGEECSGGRERASLLGDAMEAVFGAAYLDGGMKAVEKIYRRLRATDDPAAASVVESRWLDNPKGQLQDWMQRAGLGAPAYRLANEEGPSHKKRFVVTVCVNGREHRGTGASRRAAEAHAAAAAMASLAHEHRQE